MRIHGLLIMSRPSMIKLKSALASARDIAILEAQRQKWHYDHKARAVELHPGDKAGLSIRIFRHSYCGRVVQKSHSSTPKFTHPHLECTKYANVSKAKP